MPNTIFGYNEQQRTFQVSKTTKINDLSLAIEYSVKEHGFIDIECMGEAANYITIRAIAKAHQRTVLYMELCTLISEESKPMPDKDGEVDPVDGIKKKIKNYMKYTVERRA